MVSRARRHMALLLVILLAGALGAAPGLSAAEAGPLASPSPARLHTGQNPLPAEPATPTAPSDGVRLLSSTSAGVTFELEVPWERLMVERVTADGKAYVRVSLPAWQATTAQPGAPTLPFLAQAIGAPVSVDVAVRVVPGRAHTIALSAPPLPAATQEVEWGPPGSPGDGPVLPATNYVVEEDPAIYSAAVPYPGPLAEVTSDGLVRQQRVVGVAAYPLQYEPRTHELTVYESLRVEVLLEASPLAPAQVPAGESAQPESPAYEALFRGELLNYETARAWRSANLPYPSLGQGAGKETGAGTASARWAPPDPGWRVRVREDGLYRLTSAELQTAGLPVDTLDPSTFQLYHLGSEVAITVSGEDDGEFNEADSLLFYGQAPSSKYTADNVYWLTYGQENGLRMATRDGTPGTEDPADDYLAQPVRQQNQFYLPGAPGDENLDRWMWDYVYPPSRPSWSHTFSLTEPADGATATLTVAMVGNLENPIDPDHHATISLNGTQVGDVTWDGITWRILEMEIPAGLLVAGLNTLQIVCPNDTGVGVDVVWVDWVALAFANTFLAEGDELPFSYDTSGTTFQIDGFSSGPLTVYDVTDPVAPVCIDGVDVVGSGPYAAVFKDGVTAPTDYWALAERAYRTVQTIEADTPSDLGSTANGADHIVIAHSNFSNQATQLRNFRASQGLRAMWIDVQDIYDEFGYGIDGAAAIHDFLAYAYGFWQAPAPSYVVLLGDGHYDPKDYGSYGRVSYIPPYLAPVDPSLGETAADNRYVTLVGDDALPDMMLGRLAVNSSAEATAFVDKIAAYELAPLGNWQQQVLAVADNADSEYDFAAMSDDLLTCCLPEPYQAERVYYLVTHPTVDDARAAILDGINAGKLIVNYIGHAASTQWADEGLFKAADAAGLTNGGKLPLMLPMACMDGYYVFPFAASACTAEVITRAQDKGAVASWSPTGYGNPGGHRYLDHGFFDALFQDEVETVGAATAAGKLDLWASGDNLDLLDTYLLFGDPALRLPARVEAVADLQLGKTVEPAGPVLPGTVLTYTLTFTNLGPHTAHGVVLTDTLPSQLVDVEILPSEPPGPSSARAETYVRASQAPVPGEPTIWELEDLAPGAGDAIRIRATVDPLAAAGTLRNEAQISADEPDSQPSDNSAWVSNDIVIPDLTVEKTGPEEATFGETITYAIAWGNAAAVPAPGVQLTDTLPAGVSYVCDDSGWPHSEPEPGVIVWEVTPDPLPTSAEGSFVLTATVGSDLEGPLVNRVRIAAAVADDNPADNEDQWSTELLLPDLWVDKSVSPSGSVAPGTILTYTLTFGNMGPGVAHSVVLSDALPSVLVDVEILYESPEVVDHTPGETYAWEIQDLAPGDEGEIRLRATVDPLAPAGTLGNEAQISAAQPDSQPSDNSASVSNEILLPDLTVEKTGPQEATFGETITYTIAWGNAAAVAAPGVQLTDTLPAGVSYVADDSGWAHSEPQPGVIVWDVTPDPLPAGAQGTLVLTATVGSDVEGPLVNHMHVAAAVGDGDPADNDDQWATALLLPDLWIDKSVSPSGSFAPGTILTYTLTFGNAGPGIATGVALTDTLPAQLVDVEILYESPEVVSRTPGETYAWEIRDLAPGDEGEIRFRARVASDAAGDSIVNSAQIDSTGLDPDASNNQASVTTEVSMWRVHLPIISMGH